MSIEPRHAAIRMRQLPLADRNRAIAAARNVVDARARFVQRQGIVIPFGGDVA